MFCAKHTTPDGRIFLVVYDAELAGKAFHGKIMMDLNDPYYQGKSYPEETIKTFLAEADNIMLFGNQAVNLGKQENLVDENQIIFVEDIPLAMVLRISS